MAVKNSKTLPWDKLVIWGAGFVVVSLIVLSFFGSNLTLSGEEFSPELFQVRAFSYWRLPGTKLRLSSTKVGIPSSPCSKQILNHLKPNPNGPTWQAMSASQGNASDQLSPLVLTRYLSKKNLNGDLSWDDWSFHHPKEAAILWPIVQQAATLQLYLCIPDLLRTAEQFVDDRLLNIQLKLICLRAVATKQKSLRDSSVQAGKTSLGPWASDFASDVIEDPDIQNALAAIQ